MTENTPSRNDNIDTKLPLSEKEQKIIALQKAIKEGEDSGFVTDFDPKKHLQALKASIKANQ